VDETLLGEPVDRAARLVALSLIEDAQQAAAELTGLAKELRDGDTAGDEALHDFRVAVRRLRSWLRAFEPWLDDDLTRKQRRRISEVADATRISRDARVHLEWLKTARPALTARQRVGHTWLTTRLEAVRSDGVDAALDAATDFAATARKVAHKLESYSATLRESEDAALFGTVLGEQIANRSKKLRARLAKIREFADASDAHRARISVKNLRYLIEPVGKIAGSETIIQMVKSLQDSLGDLHDVHVFAEELVAATEKAAASRARRISEVVLADDKEESEEDRVRRARARDPGPGLLGLARLLHERGVQAFEKVEGNWLNDAGSEFFERVDEFAAELDHRASLGTEIEPPWLERVLDREVTNDQAQRELNPSLAGVVKEENPNQRLP
jgi:CHAD domain-containing protein